MKKEGSRKFAVNMEDKFRMRSCHLRNATGQRLDDQRAVIPDHDIEAAQAAQVVDEAARTRTFADYNHPDQYYANRSDIRPPTI